MPAQLTRCRWCGVAFPAKKRGDREKAFCGDAHRNLWNSAARAYGVAMERAGVVSLRLWTEETLRWPRSEAVHGAESPGGYSGAT